MDSDTDTRIAFGEFVLDRTDERLFGPRGPIRLGNKAFRVLLRLIDRQGRLVTKDELFSSVWDGTIVSESALTTAVKELRRALADGSKTPRYIESVYGRGYRFIGKIGSAPEGLGPGPGADGAEEPGHRPAEPEAPILCVPEFAIGASAGNPALPPLLHREVIGALRARHVPVLPTAASAASPECEYRLTVTLAGAAGGTGVTAQMDRLPSGAPAWSDEMLLSPNPPRGEIELLVERIADAAQHAMLIARRASESADLRFTAEEEVILTSLLAGLSRSRARGLLDQGFWVNGQAGDVLTREQEEVTHLYYVADGVARVLVGQRHVGNCRPGDLIGELSVLSGDVASATVTLEGAARLWCAPLNKIRSYLEAHDDVRRAVIRSFARTLRAKLARTRPPPPDEASFLSSAGRETDKNPERFL